MFDMLKQALEVVLVAAVLITFFGLVAHSNLRAARIFGWFCIAWALAVAVIEGYAWYDKGDWIITPAQQIWYQMDRSSLNEFESVVGRYFSPSVAAVADWLLNWPAWLFLSLLGIFFLAYDHIQLQRMHKGAPPPPIWKRLYNWTRATTRPSEEQA